MKKNLKGFVLGLIVATLLMSTALGAGVKKTIEVAVNSINLTVNGNKVDADNIVYEGTTYVPLRAAGEMLGKDVGWNQETNTASINDKMADKPKEQEKPIEKSVAPKPVKPKETKVTSANELKNYLQKNFGILDTNIGTTSFDFKVRENDSSFFPEDYNITVEYEYDYFGGAMYSNKYSVQEKEELKRQLKAHMEQIGRATINVMPDKKLTGSYYSFYYKYPTIREGYTSTRYYTWNNYGDYDMLSNVSAYEQTKPSDFRWYDLIDDKL